MPHRRRDGAAGHVEAAHEGLAHVAVLAVALHLRDVEHVLGDVAGHVAVDALQLDLARLGDGDPGQGVHAGDLDALGACRRGDLEAVCGDGVEQGGGAEQAGVVLSGLVVHQHAAVVDHLLAAAPHAHDLEGLGGVAGHQRDVCALAGGQGAHVGQLEGARGVDGHHLDGLGKGNALLQSDLEVVVKMAGGGQVAAVQVVGHDAHHARVDVLAHDGVELLGQGARGGRLAQHGVHAVASAVQDLLGAQGLVAGGDAGGHALVEVRAAHLDQVALRGLALHTGHVVKRLHEVGEVGQDVGAHAFGDAHGVRALEGLADDGRVEGRAAGLQSGGEGHMRRHHEVEVEVGGLVFCDDGLDALDAADHAHLVEVGHDRGGAVLEDRLCEGPDGEVGAFRVDVAVDEAGGDEGALRVDHLGPLADRVVDVAHRRDALPADGHACVDVDDLPAGDDDVCRLLAACNCQKPLVHGACTALSRYRASLPCSARPPLGCAARNCGWAAVMLR